MREGTRVRAGMAVVLCLTVLMAGCSTDWIGQGEEIVGALIPATANLVALVAALQGKTVSAADLQLIQSAGAQAGADLQLVQSLIAAYQKADAGAKPGILSQIQSAIEAAQANLEGLLAALHIKDRATQAKITAVVGILLAEVQSLAAVVPIISGQQQGPGVRGQGPEVAQVSQQRAAQVVSRPKAPLSAKEFATSFNATLTAKTGNAELDRATVGFAIHQHGKVVRWVTAGVVR